MLKDYFTFLLGRNQGVGFQYLYEAYLQKDYSYLQIENVRQFPMKVFNALDILGKTISDNKEEVKVYADFEGGNLESYQYLKGEKELVIMGRGESNGVGGEEVNNFYWGVQSDRVMSVKVTMLNVGPQVVSQKMFIYISEGEEWQPLEVHLSQQNRHFHNYRQTTQTGDDLFQNKREQQIHYHTNLTKQPCMTMTFTIDLPMAFKTRYVSRHIPYTLTNLVNYLLRQEKRLFHQVVLNQQFQEERVLIESDQMRYSREKVGCSPLGLPVYVLRIEGRGGGRCKALERKLKVLVIGRQNANDSASSFTIQSIISHLTDSSEYAAQLRELCEFHIVPMLNPDGCVLGNTSTNINGQHTRKHWSSSQDNHHYVQEIRHLKQYIHHQMHDQIFMLIEINNHNQSNNIHLRGGQNIYNTYDYAQILLGKLFFQLLQTQNPIVQMGNSHTGYYTKGLDCFNRFYYDYNVNFSYQLNISEYGYQDKIFNKQQLNPFQIHDFIKLGKDICRTIMKFVIIYGQILHDQKNIQVDYTNIYLEQMFLNYKISPKQKDDIKNQLQGQYFKEGNIKHFLYQYFQKKDTRINHNKEIISPIGQMIENFLFMTVNKLFIIPKYKKYLEHKVVLKQLENNFQEFDQLTIINLNQDGILKFLSLKDFNYLNVFGEDYQNTLKEIMFYFENKQLINEKFIQKECKQLEIDAINDNNLQHLRKELFKKNIREYEKLDLDKYENDYKGDDDSDDCGFNEFESQYSIPNLKYYLTNLTKEEQEKIQRNLRKKMLKQFLRKQDSEQKLQQQQNNELILDYIENKRINSSKLRNKLFMNKTFYFGYKYEQYNDDFQGLKFYDRIYDLKKNQQKKNIDYRFIHQNEKFQNITVKNIINKLDPNKVTKENDKIIKQEQNEERQILSFWQHQVQKLDDFYKVKIEKEAEAEPEPEKEKQKFMKFTFYKERAGPTKIEAFKFNEIKECKFEKSVSPMRVDLSNDDYLKQFRGEAIHSHNRLLLSRVQVSLGKQQKRISESIEKSKQTYLNQSLDRQKLKESVMKEESEEKGADQMSSARENTRYKKYRILLKPGQSKIDYDYQDLIKSSQKKHKKLSEYSVLPFLSQVKQRKVQLATLPI